MGEEKELGRAKSGLLESFKTFLKALRKNTILGYCWLLTIIQVFVYSIIIAILGPSEQLPSFGQVLDIYGITFILLITFSFFLLVLFVSSFISSAHEFFTMKRTLIKLIGLHLVCIVGGIFTPIFLFIGVYIFAYFLWYAISAVFLILFCRGISVKIGGNVAIKNKKNNLIFYITWWFIFIIGFGIFYMLIPWSSYSFNQQMILMVFPLFGLALPVLGLLIKPKSGQRAPISFFGIMVFIIVLYNWIRYISWTSVSINITFIDALVDMALITYTFFSLFKNANRISVRLKGKVKIEQLLLFFIWTRISSMIILLTVADYQLFGYSASEGTYLISMFLMMIIGFILGLMWLRNGITEDEISQKFSLPELAGDHVK